MDTTNDIHATTQELLPWYLNRTLGEAEHAQVEQHIRDCLSCRRELKSLSGIAEALAAPARDIAASASFAALRSRIAVPATESTAAATPEGRVIPLHRRPLLRVAIAASLLLALLPVGLDRLRDGAEDAPYYTLAAPSSGATLPADLRVVFAAGTPSSAIERALSEVGGAVSGEPNSAGALGVRLQGGRAAREQAIALLRARNDVLLAEPVNQP